MSEVVPLPSFGEVFFDSRGQERVLRVTWHDGTLVLSLWRGEMCTASFRMPLEDVGRLIDTLDDGYVEAGGDQLVESGQHAVQPQEGEHYSGDYPETGHYARPRQDDYAADYQGGEDDYQGGHYPEQETQVAPPIAAEERPQRGGGGPSDVLVARGTPGPDKLVASYNTTSDAVPRENLIVGDSLPYGRQPAGTDPAYHPDPAYQDPGYPDTGYPGGSDTGYHPGPDAGYQSDTGYQNAPDLGYAGGSDLGYQSDTGYQTAPDTGYAGGGDTGYQPLPDPGYAEGRETGYQSAPPGGARRGRGTGGPATDPYGFSASEVDDHAAYAESPQPPAGQGDYGDRYGTQPDAYTAEQYSTSPDQHGRQIPHPDPYGTSGYGDDDPGYGGGERGRRYQEEDPQGYSGVDPDDPLGIGTQGRPEGDDYYQPDAQQPPRQYPSDSLFATGERLRPEQGHDPRDDRRDW
ncbi:hypothetical protein [Spongiactinospora sp. 9N601]|uniref:hypothetical protein n=1 Tax=Spongiactinospora sp. 9N601 TaxID=3375149 RepID=UPI00379AF16A